MTIILTTTACGKKGPPLLPFVRQPRAAEITSARLMGSEVYLTISVPTANIDDSTPASIAGIEVIGLTATTTPSVDQMVKIGTRVMTIPVARYADPSDRSGRVVPDPKSGALQGTSITIRDALTADAKIPRALSFPAKATDGKSPPKGSTPTPIATAANATGTPEVVRRFYITVPFSFQQRNGLPSAIVEVPMTMIPGPVPQPRATKTGHKVDLQWEPAGGFFGWLMDRALAAEPSPVVERQAPAPAAAPAAPSGPTLYNVYVEVAPDPLALPRPPAPEAAWSSSLPVAINKQPLTTTTFADDIPFDGRQRCYVVRGVRGTGPQRVEGEPSERVCVDALDDEAPAAVTGLTATPLEGSINLRWEPNGEEDLRGYLVLRREEGSDTLQLLTINGPIAETRWPDITVLAGRMYTYVVQAVDNRIPLPNVSEPGEEVTVTAR